MLSTQCFAWLWYEIGPGYLTCSIENANQEFKNLTQLIVDFCDSELCICSWDDNILQMSNWKTKLQTKKFSQLFHLEKRI